MAEGDTESKFDEMERDSLQKAISQVETKLIVSTPGTRTIFETFLLNAKGRVATLDQKIKHSQTEQESRAREQTEVFAYLAEKEAALSASEKETYSGFLGKDFFTKKDFGSLEQFYAHTWDRLSEGGKNQMSHRIWEGIRRDEHKFSELPKTVREKETQQAYNLIRHPSAGVDGVSQIPAKDRDDFIRAYESGNKQEASKVLDRESFKANLFRGAESKEVKSAQVQTGRNGEGKPVGEKIAAGKAPGGAAQPGESAGKAKNGFQDINLDGLKLADASSPPSSANIPRGAPVLAKSVPSLGSG